MEIYLYGGKEIDITQPFVGPDGEQFGLGVLMGRPDKMAEYGIVVQTIAAPVVDAAASRLEFVKRQRDALTQAGGYPVHHDGVIYWFHSDAFSLIQQLGLITAAREVLADGGDLNAPLIPIPWQTLGRVGASMTAALALKLLPASMAQQGAIFAHATALEAALRNAEEPETVDIASGWPEVFKQQ